MSKSKTKTIGITLGDPAGIGPEVIAKALTSNLLRQKTHFAIIGDWNIFQRFASPRLANISFFDLGTISINKILPGKPTAISANASLQYLNKALELLKQKRIHGLVTGPVSKQGICSLGVKFQGHTEYIAQSFKVKNFGMMFVADAMKTVVVTRHIPLKDISITITKSLLKNTILLTYQTLKSYFKIKNPSIALCGLNPHAGEGGTIGCEETTTLIPTIHALQKLGLKIAGPFPADTLFHPARSKNFDAIIAMYHDQGLIPVKTVAFDNLVNLTMGLPFIRTSPAHGTAFDIAGKNKADPSSMMAAMALAAKLTT